MKRIVCLISGRGSNLAALLETAHLERWDETLPAAMTLVISNRAEAVGLEIARRHGVATAVIAHRDYASREAFEAALIERIDVERPDIVVLAGFMRVLTDGFVARYAGRLINIHPSLLPAFPGLVTHRRALDAGVRIHGATVHFVSPAVDGGPIIAQAVVVVREDDEEHSLAERVLAQEHRLLPRCVRWIAQGRVRLDGSRVVVTGLTAAERAIVAAPAS
jgi:phosphoribosylglycinamide formyltransferase-1